MSTKKYVRVGACAAFLVAFGALVPAPLTWAEEGERPKVLILGTFHFTGSKTDEISVTMGDVRSPRRQAEIENLNQRLMSFAPTKIAVELVPEREKAFNEKYHAYKSSKSELSADERQQIGMRLAKKLGHEKLYGVDARQNMDINQVFAAAEAAGQTKQIAAIQAKIGEIEASLKQAQAPEKTILDALRFHNGPLLESGNQLYLMMATLGTADHPGGAEVVGTWYERNLKIYANIARLAEGPNERILVIYGSGHAPHLTSFFEQNPDFTLVPAMSVLAD